MADKQLPTRNTAAAVRPESLPTPADKTELRGLRSTHGKQFLHPEKATNGDNIITCETRIGAVCYRDDNGELRSIDTTVRDLGDGVIGVEWAPYEMVLHETGVGFDFRSREGGKCSVKLVGIGGETFDSEAILKPEIEGNVITFREVRPGCDIVFKCLNQRVKTLRILRDADAPKTFEWLCGHDAAGRDKIDDTLTGTDAADNQLELSAEVVPVNERSYRCVETWPGQVKVITDPATRIRSLSDDVSYPVEIDPTFSANITVDTQNDVYDNGGSVNTYTQLRFGKSAGSYAVQTPGFRWPSCTVPNAATITSATLGATFSTIWEGSGGSGTLNGVASDNTSVFSTGNMPSLTSKTTANTSIPSISSTGTKSYDVTSIVQEIVNRAGWASGNAMSFVMSPTGAFGNRSSVTDYSAGSGMASLSITYTAAASGGSANLLLLGCG